MCPHPWSSTRDGFVSYLLVYFQDFFFQIEVWFSQWQYSQFKVESSNGKRFRPSNLTVTGWPWPSFGFRFSDRRKCKRDPTHRYLHKPHFPDFYLRFLSCILCTCQYVVHDETFYLRDIGTRNTHADAWTHADPKHDLRPELRQQHWLLWMLQPFNVAKDWSALDWM